MKKYVCGNCYDDNLVFDAQASWSDEYQEWELEHVHEQAICLSCYAKNEVLEINIEGAGLTQEQLSAIGVTLHESR